MSDKVIACSAFVAIQVPCNVVSAALAGRAQARTSPVEIINQHIFEVRRCMTTSPAVLHRSTV
jgi:hypothetical protein